MASVKIVTNTPGAAPKPQRYADIKDQGKDSLLSDGRDCYA